MLELVIMIGVVKAFANLADEKRLSKGLWGFIGAISYYGPIVLLSFVILPWVLINGYWIPNSELEIQVSAFLINLVVGISSCYLAFQYLKSLNPKDSDILDDGIGFENEINRNS